MNMVRLYGLLIILNFGSVVKSQTLRDISSITTADGLSQGYVTSVFQDTRGFIWIGTLYGLNRYDGYEIKSYTPEVATPWTLRSNSVYSICEGSDGIIWFGSEKGLVAFDPYSERFVHFDGNIGNIPRGSIEQVLLRKNGAIILRGGNKNHVFEVHPPKDLLRMIRAGTADTATFGYRILSLSKDIKIPIGQMRLANDSMLMLFDANSKLCKADLNKMTCSPAAPGDFNFSQIGAYGLIRCTDGKGYVFHLSMVNNKAINSRFIPVFIASEDKYYLYQWFRPDILEMNIKPDHNAVPDMDSPDFLKQFGTRFDIDKPCSGAILSDISGDLWAGTNGYGLRVLREKKEGVSQFANHISFSNFTCLNDDQIWPGHFKRNIVYNVETDRPENTPWINTLPDQNSVSSLHIDKNGNYWAMTGNSEVSQFRKYDASTGIWSVLPVFTGRINGDRTVITGDKNGNVWFVAGNARIIKVNAESGKIDEWSIASLFPPGEIKQFQSYSAADDNHNNLWIGTSCGLLRIDYGTDEPSFQAYHNYTSGGVLFASNHLLSVCPDRNNRNVIWVGTNGGGLCKFDIISGKSQTFNTHNGLTDNVVYGILPDVTGKLWMSTNRGITCHDPSTGRFFNPFPGASALNVEFNTGAYRLLNSGRLAFGSVDGLFIIDPLRFVSNTGSVKVTVSSLRIKGDEFNSPENAGFVSFNEQHEYQIDVPYSHNNISVSFVALPENSEKSIIYRYRIPAISSEWIETGKERTINIAGITYGNYTVEIQAATQNGNWSESTTLHLQIHAPWYAGNAAWFTYFILVFVGISYVSRRRRKQMELKHAVELGKVELDRLKTMDEFKARFYSYITHEFKTPLTILLNLTGRLTPGNSPRELDSIKDGISRQAENMLELVNQVIDISRFHDKNPELHWRQGDIGNYVNLWVESFRPLAEFKQIKLEYSTDAAGLVMDFDPIRLKYIINNLLSNALRHTAQGGSIKVALDRCNDSRICLKVTDDGEGIAQDELPFIFDRNFRGKSRSRGDGHFGLGLAFVKDLIFLFNGDIKVESQPGVFTKFTIYLPITNTAPLMEAEPLPPVSAADDSGNQLHATGKKPLLLVVDDNQIILSYLQSFLSRYFQVLAAPDGKVAWDMALEHLPDIVLTDLVMPELDGLQLTDKLKAHELTCHIPVVMLSARAEVEDRIEGHQHGADGFVPKPFHEQELVLILQNMLLLQERWRKRFESGHSSGKPVQETNPVHQEESDHKDPFMRRLYGIFEAHFSEEDFDLDQLCHQMLISRSQLQRKLSAVASESAMELLREFRLNKARELFLGSPDMQVKEVCTKTGFKNPAHFSTLFTKRFGISPSELRKQHED